MARPVQDKKKPGESGKEDAIEVMATVIEPKTSEESKPQAETPMPAERELFAAEIEMEGKSPNFFPILFIAGLIIVVGGTIYYFVKGAKDVLTAPVATTTISQILTPTEDGR